jgi:hypothetical protein
MQGIELNALANIRGLPLFQCECLPGLDVDVLVGFRWWNFNERILFTTGNPTTASQQVVLLAQTTSYITEDRFHTFNNFYGGQIGIQGTYYFWRNLYVEAKGKVAVGAMRETLQIKGEYNTPRFNAAGVTQTFPAGYFALPTNTGRFSRTRFATIPEVKINLGYDVSDYLSFYIGYTFLYASNVLRAGQIDRRINPSQSPAITGVPSTTLVGPASPRPKHKTDDLWAQGLNVGIEGRY